MSPKAQFLICSSCFWCASVFASYFQQSSKKCPRCGAEVLDSLPLVLDEACKLGYSAKRRVELEFA